MWTTVSRGRAYAFWKEGGKQHRQLLSRWLWEQANGPIPDGHEIHHRDHNPLNNDLDNLQCVTAEWHDDYHQRLREDHRTIDGVEHRRCQRCNEYQPLDRFSKRTAGTYHGYCKHCQLDAHREWKQRNPGYQTEYNREWRKRNPERDAEHARRSREKHRERNLAYLREYRRRKKAERESAAS